MNKKTYFKHKKEITDAWSRGESIECKQKGIWQPFPPDRYPIWFAGLEFRIKKFIPNQGTIINVKNNKTDKEVERMFVSMSDDGFYNCIQHAIGKWEENTALQVTKWKFATIN